MSRVLIIDDDLSHHKLAEVLIKKYSVFDDCTFYTNPESALQDLVESSSSNSDPDVVLLDLNMPGFNGWEFLDMIKRNKQMEDHPVDIYIVTSSVDPNDFFRSQEYSVVKGFFSKPISPAILKEIAPQKSDQVYIKAK